MSPVISTSSYVPLLSLFHFLTIIGSWVLSVVVVKFLISGNINLYFELLTELGLIGTLVFLSFIFFILRQTKRNYQKSSKEIKSLIFGSCLVILFYLWPLRSSGSFLSTFNGSFFWFNLGIILLLSNIKVEKIEK